MGNRAVFLDRDGTIIEDSNYLSRADDMVVYPFSAEALRKLKEAGFLIVVVTNQSAIGRGFLNEEDLARIHEALDAAIEKGGAAVDAYYYCPHHPEATIERYRKICNCRKPSPGLILQAASELEIDLEASYFVGDNLKDIQAGQSVGCRTILVKTGYGASFAEQMERLREKGETDCLPDHISDNLREAADWIVSEGT